MAESSVRATAQVDDDKMARRKALCLCCKKAAKFAFTNIGLSVIVVVYAIAGAFIFQILEQTNEKEECIQASLFNSAVGLLMSCYDHGVLRAVIGISP